MVWIRYKDLGPSYTGDESDYRPGAMVTFSRETAAGYKHSRSYLRHRVEIRRMNHIYSCCMNGNVPYNLDQLYWSIKI